MKFPQEFIERVAEANNLVDIISQYTQLKPSGGGLMGRCPFPDHPEKTPSFSVSESKQVYNCFGCHKKGNIFTFLQQYNGMSFKEAVEYLADRAQISIPKPDDYNQQAADLASERKRQVARANQVALQYFRKTLQALNPQHPVMVYLQKRGLNPEIVETFQIGFSSDNWEGLVHELESKKIPLKIAEEAKLIKARTSGKTGYFDLFRERLMFPIISMIGETVGFGGRIIAQGEPKYLNSPETPVFHKGKILYGLSQTAKFIRSEDQAIIVEGYMDLISLYGVGIKNVAATMGTALTLDHGKILSRMTKNVVVLFDGDSAGQEAAERSLPILLAADVYPKGLTLPGGQDPDDYVKENGGESLLNLVKQAKDLFTLILESWLKDYRGEASEKVRLASKLTPVFAQIKDLRLKQLYLKEAAFKLGVEERWLAQANSSKNDHSQNRNGSPQPTPQFRSENAPRLNQSDMQKSNQVEDAPGDSSPELINLNGATPAEQILLGLVLKSSENFKVFESIFPIEEIPHVGFQLVLKRIAEVYRQAPEKFDKLASLLTNYVNRPDLLISDQEMQSQDSQLIVDCVRKLKERRILEKRTQLTQELKRSVAGSENYQAIMKSLMDLKLEELNLKKSGSGNLVGNNLG